MTTKPDIFISFKNLGENGEQTRDSVLAQEIYDFLMAQGLNVFYSNISLQKLGISAYKREIDNALDSAKILIAVGTSGKNLDSQWVRYEWDSFFNDILSGIKPDGRIFTYVENIPIPSLPRTLRQSQVFSHGSGSMERLFNFIVSSLGKEALDLESKTAQIKDCILRVREHGEAWRTGCIENWLAQDSKKILSRMVLEWGIVSPDVRNRMSADGWPDTSSLSTRQAGKPRIWDTNDDQIIADKIITAHRLVYPADFQQRLILQKNSPPIYPTPPWFTAHLPGGDLEVTCKQCLYHNDDFNHYQDQIPPGECPQCGLGHRDWFSYNFNPTIDNPGHDRICKRCGYTIRMRSPQDDPSFPSFCPHCELGKEMAGDPVIKDMS